MMSHGCGVGRNIKVGKLRGDNDTCDWSSDADMMKSLHGMSSSVLIAAKAASWC